MKSTSIILSQVIGAILLLLLICIPNVAQSQWSIDPAINNPICTESHSQENPVMTKDGSGGAIIAWVDYRSETAYAIYAQKINSKGIIQWTTNGILVAQSNVDQENPQIISDGNGGAIIVWNETRNNIDKDIYGQKITSTGTRSWGSSGTPVCTFSGDQTNPILVSDNSGGAVIAWSDFRNVSDIDIYAQHLNTSGSRTWNVNGVAIVNVAYDQDFAQIITDGAGGAIITWEDGRNGSNTDIYAQNISSSGVHMWASNGIVVCNAIENQKYPSIVSDDMGGAIISWQDMRNSTDYDIYSQKFTATGDIEWTDNGLSVVSEVGNQQNVTTISDGDAGVILAWEDDRNATDFNIYTQWIKKTKHTQWNDNGQVICESSNDQRYPQLVSDGDGGAIITWEDRSTVTHVYAQHILLSGYVSWTNNGIPISIAPETQTGPIIVTDDNHGAIITWVNYSRITEPPDIYVQQVDYFGFLGGNAPTINNVKDVPNDQGGKVIVGWLHSQRDVFPGGTIGNYTLWREAIITATQAKSLKVITPQELTSDFHGGAYLRQINGVCTTYWDYIQTIPAVYKYLYSYTAPTFSDSMAGNNGRVKFMVIAQGYYAGSAWESNIDSGYSVDNLSPSPVHALAAVPQGGDVVNVRWAQNTSDPDLGYFDIYRSTNVGFTPGPATKIGFTADTVFVDGSAIRGVNNYYRVISSDIHGNTSVASDQAQAAVTITTPYSVSNKWNIVSVPLTVNNYLKTVIYPGAISQAFYYNNGYATATTLTNGSAYWLKFDADQPVNVTGFIRSSDTIHVRAGWNMIGSISSPVNITNIQSTPSGMVTSSFFGYNNGYTSSTIIEPGKGYWVKVNQSGILILSSVVENKLMNTRIKIVDNGEIPPPPPGELTNTNTLTIPSEFSLSQNYPNPFNPTTKIRYELPLDSWVTLKIYDILGIEVSTLLNEQQNAGIHIFTFDAGNLPSGVYMYKLITPNFMDYKKMVLTR